MGLFTRTPVKEESMKVLTAAAKKVEIEGINQIEKDKRGGQQWQKDAWDYYDQVGELHYAVSFYAACVRRVKLRIALRDKHNDISPAFDEEGKSKHPQAEQAAEVLRTLHPSTGGQGELTSTQAGNLVVAGECYLVGEPDETGVIPYWEILSIEELVMEGGEWKRVVGEGSQDKKPLAENSIILRNWKAHFRHSQKADSSVRPVLEVLEELVLLTRGVRATTMSRLAGAGVLFIPQEIAAAVKNPDGTVSDDFVTDLIRTMTEPIKDKAAASAVVPLVVTAPGERIEQVQHLDFTRNFDSYPSVELRKEAVRRLAQGLYLPIEIITGEGGANHWSAWAIDESTFKAHIEPLMELICEADTDWLETQMQELTLDSDGRQCVVYFDASELIIHPNQSADAIVLHNKYVISDAKLRDVAGFAAGDAPDEEEVAERMARDIALNSRGFGEPPPADPAQGADEVKPGPPDSAAALRDRTAAAVDVTVNSAIERVGAKLRSKLNGKAGVRSVIEGVHNRSVASTLGPGVVSEAFGATELFAGEFTALAHWATDDAKAYGLEGTEPGLFAEQVVASAEKLARARMYDPSAQLPANAFDLVSVTV